MAKQVSERIDVVMLNGKSMDRESFLEKVDEMYRRNMHGPHNTYSFSIEHDKTIGVALFFMGTRDETNDEMVRREAEERARNKAIKEAELKEYLRLHKIYGKKERQ